MLLGQQNAGWVKGLGYDWLSQQQKDSGYESKVFWLPKALLQEKLRSQTKC